MEAILEGAQKKKCKCYRNFVHNFIAHI
uniref:Uncharacterized protein n=1 Tax=Arundo donax TaxID=35708 RepID=A0A0A8Z6N7_ARUDO